VPKVTTIFNRLNKTRLVSFFMYSRQSRDRFRLWNKWWVCLWIRIHDNNARTNV